MVFGVLALALAIVVPMTAFAGGGTRAGITIEAVDSATGDTLSVRVAVSGAADLGGGDAADGVAATGTATYRDQSEHATTTVDIACIRTFNGLIVLLSTACPFTDGTPQVLINLGVSPLAIESDPDETGSVLNLPHKTFDAADPDKITLGIAVRSFR